MNPLKRILGHIYFGYALLMFAITLLIVFIPVWVTSLLREPRRTRALHVIFRIWMGVYMPLVCCPVRRRGKEHFAAGENYVVICNHNSFADVPVSSPWIPGPNKTLAKVEMARIPIFGLIYKSGAVLVDRKSEGNRRESFNKMQEMLEMGLHLCLYPEGTRNKTAAPIQPFYDGAFITAVRAQKAVMPALIFNTKGILPMKPKAWAWPSRVHFHFLAPVPTRGLEVSDIGALKDQLHRIMTDYYVANKSALA